MQIVSTGKAVMNFLYTFSASGDDDVAVLFMTS
jgi:hypothetical protein